MKYGYIRVSSKRQASDGNSIEAQKTALFEAGAEQLYIDVSSGANIDRPELDKLLNVIKPNDTLIVTKLDRVARSSIQGSELITSLLSKDVRVHILNMGLMDNTPTGKLIRTILLAFAEFERDLIIERTQEGKEIAKLDPSYKEGRPLKYKREQLNHALFLLEQHSLTKVESLTGISKSTLLRAKKRKISYNTNETT